MKKTLFILLLSSLVLTGCQIGELSSDGETQIVDDDDDDSGTEKTVYSIKITKQPNKRTYYVGDIFDPTGMVVEVHYTDKSTKEITDYTYPKTPVVLGQTSVTISYKNKTADVSIVVKEKQDEDLTEYTTTIDFHGSSFTNEFTDGTNFDNADKFRQLCDYIDLQLEYYDLINGISCTRCATRKVDGDTYLQIGTGSAAKGEFNSGNFIWSSEEKIYYVEIVAFNYSKPYQDWSTGETIHNVDNMGHIKIDDVDGSLEVGVNDAPKTITLSKTYEQGTNSFKLSSTGGRVLIKEMTITWRG